MLVTLTEELGITPSRVEQASQCYRKHALQSMLSLRQQGMPTPASLAFGTVMHDAVGELWGGRFGFGDAAQDPEQAAMAKLRESYAANLPSLDGDARHTLDLAEFLLRHYIAEVRPAAEHYAAHDTANWVPMVIESRMTVELPSGAGPMTFKVDRLLRHEPTGEMVLVDLKTASPWGRGTTFAKPWRQQWAQSLQMKLYAWAVGETLQRVPQVWIEGMLKHVPTELAYVACPDWTQSELLEAAMFAAWVARQNMQLVQQCREDSGALDIDRLLRLAAIALPFDGSHCHAYGKDCDFLPLCSSPPDERYGLLLSDYETFKQEYV